MKQSSSMIDEINKAIMSIRALDESQLKKIMVDEFYRPFYIDEKMADMMIFNIIHV